MQLTRFILEILQVQPKLKRRDARDRANQRNAKSTVFGKALHHPLTHIGVCLCSPTHKGREPDISHSPPLAASLETPSPGGGCLTFGQLPQEVENTLIGTAPSLCAPKDPCTRKRNSARHFIFMIQFMHPGVVGLWV